MPHLKRQEVPKNWPIHRKGNTWVVRPNANLNNGVPVLIALRDILKISQNRKEVKKAINESLILLNGRRIKDEKNSITLFDVVTIVPSKKSYKLSLNEKGKFTFEEISGKESECKISKIVNKKLLKKKQIQLNLMDGRNLLSDVKCKTNDSVVINLKTKKIEKCLELKDNANVIVYGGKHAGVKGKINKIDSKHQRVELDKNGEKINVLIKHLVITE